MASAPTSETALCNVALSKIKQPSISTIESPSTPAENACALHFHTKRRALLTRFAWGFAIVRASIPADSATPAFGFTKQFTLPNGVLRFLGRYDTDGVLIHPDDRAIEGRKLLVTTDATSANIRYVSDHTTVSEWHPLFVDLFTTSLAMAIAPALVPQSVNVVRTLAVLEASLLDQATTAISQENPITRITNSDVVLSRIL